VEVAGLAKFFTLPGAFGDESFDRRDLPEKAVERINRHLDLRLGPRQFIVIGDTPNDIACARHYGARVLAVGTGRIHPLEELLAGEPDAFLADLTDVELFMKTLAKL
jgi:phosphoglycolate phosphatase-like HAD superfamily hydrolase